MGAVAFDPTGDTPIAVRLGSRSRITSAFDSETSEHFAHLRRELQMRITTVVREWRRRRDGADRPASLFTVADRAALGVATHELWDAIRYDEESALVIAPPSPHIAASPAAALESIFFDAVGRFDAQAQRPQVDDDQARHLMFERVAEVDADKGDLVQNVDVNLGHRVHRFALGWTNGQRNYADAITFDYTRRDTIVDKAEKWAYRLEQLDEHVHARFVAVTHPPRFKELFGAYETALRVLEGTGVLRIVIPTDQLQQLSLLIVQDAKHES